MSCYNWESGTIKIPAKEWAKFRTGLIKAWNEIKATELEKTRRLHAEAKARVKGKRGSKRTEALDAFLERHEASFDNHLLYRVVRWEKGKRVLAPAPRKKDFKILPTSKSCVMHLDGEATITLDNASRTVTWDVAENNRAVERSRRHPMADHLFRRLSRITWTRGSGGQIVGNDEYNREADYAGGGGNYVTDEYGPEAQRRQRAQLAAFNRRTGLRSTGRSWY